jgi:hypothetical protein
MDMYQALGSRKTVEWADMYQLLKMQIIGEDGPLVVRGRNFFFTEYAHGPRGIYLFSLWRDSDNRWMLSRRELTEAGGVGSLDRIFVR